MSFTNLLPAVSPARMEAYRPEGGTDFETLVNYFWNVELCKALYPPIHALEISLRNGVHTAASHHYGTTHWFDEPDVLLEGQRDLIQAARNRLIERRKPQTTDDIVAAMTFGFWVSLFNKPFESSLPPAPSHRLAWHDANGHPSSLFTATFPHVPNRVKSRRKISKRCNSILSLRNRVMHHESIWKYRDLSQRHAEILEAIAWLSPAMSAAIALCDDFPTVHAVGKTTIEARLRLLLSSTER